MDVTPRSIARESPGPGDSHFSPIPGTAAGAFRLEIGELILYGFPAAHRHRLADACEGELHRLCDGQALDQPASGLTGTALSIAGGTTPEITGVALARALHAALYPKKP